MLLVYDVTNRTSFENVTHWMQQIEEHTETVDSGSSGGTGKPVIVLVGNKCDNEEKRTVSSEEERVCREA